METESAARRWTAREILEALGQHRDELRELGVRKIGLFGSYSRDEARPGSDIDFLVTFDPLTFDNYANLMNLLEDLFGCEVDVVPEQSLRPALRPHVSREVIYAQGV